MLKPMLSHKRQICIAILAIFHILSISAQPVIHSFSPHSGMPGTTVTIYGNNFSLSPSSNIVYFGAVRATVNATTSTSVTVTVPAGATYHPLSLTVNAHTAYSDRPFNLTAAPPFSGISNISFSPKVDFTTEAYPNSITGQDLDGDGLPEIVLLNQQSNTIAVYRNTGGAGQLGFGSPVIYPAGKNPRSVTAGDLNGDGKPDLVFGSYDSSRIIIYLNKSTPGTLLFGDKMELVSGENPISVEIADLDSDGKPDIAAVNNNGHSVSVFRNTSNATNLAFNARQNFSTGDWPQRMTIGDFDGDKKLDIAVPNFNSNTVSILKNNSTTNNISFAAKVDLPTGASPFNTHAADLNGDGKTDLIVTNGSSSFSVFRNISNSGTLAFGTREDITTGATPLYPCVNDLDGDGKPDIALANFSMNSISILKNKSTQDAILFETKTDYSTNMSPRVLIAGDLNGDGQPDLAFVNSNANNFSVLINKMRNVPVIQNFSPKSGSTDSIISIFGTNFNNVTGISFGNMLAKSFTVSPTMIRATLGEGATGDIVLQTTAGTSVANGFNFYVPAPKIVSFQPVSGQVGTTVTIKGQNFLSRTNEAIQVYFGAVSARIIAATDTSISVTVPAGATFMPPTVTVNQLTAYAAQPFTVTFPNSGSLITSYSFAPKKEFILDNAPSTTAIHDFNGDGKADMVITGLGNSSLTFFKNISSVKNISFGPQQKEFMPYYPDDAAVGDLDGDGKPDLALSNPNFGKDGFVTIKRNTSTLSDISFGENMTFSVGDGAFRISIGDLDEDGKPDLVAYAGNAANISIYKNTSEGPGKISFAAPYHIRALYHSDHGVITDIDGDGKPDIITADFGGYSISVWKNNTISGGSFSFSNAVKYDAGQFPNRVVTGDFNRDGKPDIAVTNYGSHNISIFRNNSSPGVIAMSGKTDHPVGKNPRSIAAGDLDGDGRPDLMVSCDSPSMVTVFRNVSSSTVSFINQASYKTLREAVNVVAADLDGNGKSDIIALNDYSKVSIFRNRIDEPVIESFSPNTAKSDSFITIKGAQFTTTSKVQFGEVDAATFQVSSDSVIIATIKNGASGVVKVTNLYGEDTLGKFTYIPPVPVIQSFFPASGTVGSVIQIKGRHFGGVHTVSFGGMKAASFTKSGDTLITAVIDKGSTGRIIVSGTDGNDTINQFTFIPPIPVIASFSPTIGTTGTQVLIKGRNLSWTKEVSFGNSKSSSFTILSDTAIRAIIANGNTGVVKVETEFGTDTTGGFIFLEKDAVLAYPNPSSSFTAIAHPSVESISQIRLLDNNGRIIRTIIIPEKTTSTKIDLTLLNPGIYRVVWSDSKNNLQFTIIVR